MRLLLASLFLAVIALNSQAQCADKDRYGRSKSHSPRRATVTPSGMRTTHRGSHSHPDMKSSHEVRDESCCCYFEKDTVTFDTATLSTGSVIRRYRTQTDSSCLGCFCIRNHVHEDTTRYAGHGELHTMLSRTNSIRKLLVLLNHSDTYTVYELFLLSKSPIYKLSERAISRIAEHAPLLLTSEGTINPDDVTQIQTSFMPIANESEVFLFITASILNLIDWALSQKIAPLLGCSSTRPLISDDELNVLYSQYRLIAHPRDITQAEVQTIIDALNKATRTYPLPILPIYPQLEA